MRRLQPRQGRNSQAIMMTLVALFWNGVTWALGVQFIGIQLGLIEGSIEDLPRLDEPWGIAVALGIGLFFVPFITIGVLLAARAVLAFVLLLDLLPQVEAASDRVAPGQRLRLRILPGARAALAPTLTYSFRGQEEVDTTIGTSTRTDIHVFHRQQLAVASGSARQQIWEGEVTVPPGARPSIPTGSHRVLWMVNVSSTLLGLTIDEDYLIQVR